MPSLEEARRRHARHYYEVLSTAHLLYALGGSGLNEGLRVFDEAWDNIQTAYEWAAAPAGRDSEADEMCSLYASTAASLLSLRRTPRERLRWFEGAREAARRLNDRRAEVRHLSNLGITYANLSETHRAIGFHEEQLRLARDIGDRYWEASAPGHLGNAYFEAADVERALACHEQHLSIARRIGDRHGECSALGNIGKGYALRGEERRAIEFYEQALAGSREVGDRHGEADSLFNIGLALETLGDLPAAAASVEAALSIYEMVSPARANLARRQLEAWQAGPARVEGVVEGPSG